MGGTCLWLLRRDIGPFKDTYSRKLRTLPPSQAQRLIEVEAIILVFLVLPSKLLDVHEDVLRNGFGSDPITAFPGHGEMKPSS
jgi:hypothetical protein